MRFRGYKVINKTPQHLHLLRKATIFNESCIDIRFVNKYLIKINTGQYVRHEVLIGNLAQVL